MVISHPLHRYKKRQAFTLIELLVVIAIIAILAVVVVLTLNPAQLLAQSRDANRVSDMATLSSALNLYTTDQAGASAFSLGNASNTAISIYDSTASSTCGSLGLPAFSSGSWLCASSSTYRNASSSGWIPVNLGAISAGSPISNLPVDPVNQTSSGLFYTYNTNGSQFEVTADLESSKYKAQYGATLQTNYFPEVISGGTQGVSALYNSSGLIGYWNLDEGSGSSTVDKSGNGNIGTWNGIPIGSNGTYYTTGKVGTYAGGFDGSSTYIGLPSAVQLTGAQTESLWIDPFSWSGSANGVGVFGGAQPAHVCGNGGVSLTYTTGNFRYAIDNSSSCSVASNISLPSLNAWTFVTVSWDGTSGANALSAYINGVLNKTGAGLSGPISWGSYSFNLGSDGQSYKFNGLIDDVRIYNRVLSPAEVMALYNSEK